MLCFDCIVADGQNVMDRNLEKRYGVSTQKKFLLLTQV